MDEVMAAIRRAITNEEASEMTLAPAGRAANPLRQNRCPTTVARSNSRSRLCVPHVDGDCEEARTVTRGSGSRNASSHAQVVA